MRLSLERLVRVLWSKPLLYTLRASLDFGDQNVAVNAELMRQGLVAQLLRENQHLQKEVEDMRRLNDRAAALLNPRREAEPLREAEPVLTVDMPPAPPCPSPCQRRAPLKRIRQD